ncbi:DUF5677 domain-containing protein [Roseateles sp. BYS78W]|uniref:DUF5677 domain-containing protein n=1 Tax=Pelomonas candidula TaxID=3299025 RepID=A0ABW7H944_9BURK
MQNDLRDQGFLNSWTADVRPFVREKYATWRTLLLDVNARCVSLHYEAKVNADEPRALLAAAHFARLLASVQAAVILLEHGLLAQAKALLRVALESLFALAAVEAKPEVAMALALSQEADKRTIADRILRWQQPNLKAAVATVVTEAELNNYLTIKTPEIKTFELAKAADMVDWYLSLYSLLSFPTHGSVSDISSHLITDAAGQVVGLKNEPEIDGQTAAWAWALEIEIRAADAFAAVFGPIDFSMDDARTRLQTLSDKAES